jgi:hypothetical protein
MVKCNTCLTSNDLRYIRPNGKAKKINNIFFKINKNILFFFILKNLLHIFYIFFFIYLGTCTECSIITPYQDLLCNNCSDILHRCQVCRSYRITDILIKPSNINESFNNSLTTPKFFNLDEVANGIEHLDLDMKDMEYKEYKQNKEQKESKESINQQNETSIVDTWSTTIILSSIFHYYCHYRSTQTVTVLTITK